MEELGSVITAIVTPFDEQLRVDEDAFVSLMSYLAANGSDGFVVCGTTGEAATLSDGEHLGLVELAVRERPSGVSIIAGAGSNDTRHAVHLTKRACELGVDAILSVTPYYNRPSRRGIVRHFEEVALASDVPVILYNIPQRTGTDMPNDLLAELAQIERIDYVKQANANNLAPVDGLRIYAGDDVTFARTLDMGEPGGILVASHIVGPQMRRMVDEPEHRREIDAGLQDVYRDMAIAPAACTIKAALQLIGVPAGQPRLPYVALDADELAVVRGLLERHGMLAAAA
jgi:4-hydroxy-tetrahydrodipicolinate synthase